MYTLLIVFIIIASLLMIGIVLIQESKGGGLASNFSSSNSIMGVRKTTDVVEKTTWGLAIAMVVLSVICAYVAPSAIGEGSVMENAATQSQSTNPTNTQGFGAGQAPTQGGQKAAPAAGKSAPAAGNNAAAPAGNAPTGNAAPAGNAPAPAK
ncbi:MAG: preprotein translocase subunit SecG [Prevotella sp.]|jgi:preprotein translocase subunit SecG